MIKPIINTKQARLIRLLITVLASRILEVSGLIYECGFELISSNLAFQSIEVIKLPT